MVVRQERPHADPGNDADVVQHRPPPRKCGVAVATGSGGEQVDTEPRAPAAGAASIGTQTLRCPVEPASVRRRWHL